MMALSGVRNSWLMVARKRLLAALARSASRARVLKRLFLLFAFGHVAQHGDDLAAIVNAGIRCRLFERPAAHFDPDELRRRDAAASGASHRTRNSTDRLSPKRRRIAERGQISRPVGDMDAAEQPLAVQIARARSRTATGQPATQTAPRHRGRAA